MLITKFDAAIDIVEEANQHWHEAFRSEEKIAVLLGILTEIELNEKRENMESVESRTEAENRARKPEGKFEES